jgi:hypothetical protein
MTGANSMAHRGAQLMATLPCSNTVSWCGMRAASLLLTLLLMLALIACDHKPKTTPPPQAQAPTVTPSETQKTPGNEPSQAKPEPGQAEQTPEQASTTTPPPKPKPRPHRPAPKPVQTDQKPPQQPSQPAPQQQASNIPPKLPPATNPPATNPPPNNTTPASPGMPADEVLHSRGTTEQLLEASEHNLRNIKRQLTTDEQQMLQQCRNYISQARAAQTDGDQTRARTLALKAHLLSDALITP